MPRNKEDLKEYKAEYYKKNKEKINEKCRIYYENNKEPIKEYNKDYYHNNKVVVLEKQKQYYDKTKQKLQEPKYKKAVRICAWKQVGLIHDNYEALYEHYINTFECDNCGIELVSGNYGANRRCMDHDHITGKFRNILCCSCNLERGYDDNSNNLK